MKPTRKLFNSIGFRTFAVFECQESGEQSFDFAYFINGSIHALPLGLVTETALRHYILKIERFLVKGGYDVSLLDPYKAVLPEWEGGKG